MLYFLGKALRCADLSSVGKRSVLCAVPRCEGDGERIVRIQDMKVEACPTPAVWNSWGVCVGQQPIQSGPDERPRRIVEVGIGIASIVIGLEAPRRIDGNDRVKS